MVEDYLAKKNLKNIGYVFDPKDITDFEVSCFGIIANKFAEIEELEMKKKG